MLRHPLIGVIFGLLRGVSGPPRHDWSHWPGRTSSPSAASLKIAVHPPPRDFDRLRSSTGDNQMKRLVLTFLSTAAVCAVVSATPAAAQDTVTGAPRSTAPVTVEGYGNSSGSTAPTAPAIGSALSVPASATAAPERERCHVTRDFNDAHARDMVVCGP